jgi:hypothetical protein
MYCGTSEVEHILRVGRGKVTIGNDPNDSNLGTSDIRMDIEDADRYINVLLSDSINSLPVSPTPDGLNFASKYYTAYLTYSILFAANKPGKLPAVVETWKDMALAAVKSYKEDVKNSGVYAKWTKTTTVFTNRGVSGVEYQGADGIIEDDDILDKS